jgi:hypothetical protein
MQAQHALTADLDAGRWGKVPTHTVWSAAWLPCGALLTGGEDGGVTTWRGGAALARTHAHGRGRDSRRPDGTLTPGGVRAVQLQRDQMCAAVLHLPLPVPARWEGTSWPFEMLLCVRPIAGQGILEPC